MLIFNHGSSYSKTLVFLTKIINVCRMDWGESQKNLQENAKRIQKKSKKVNTISLILTDSNAPLSQVPQNGLKGAAYLSAAVAKAVWEILPETLTVTRATVCHHSFAAMQGSSIHFQDLISSMNIRNLPQGRRKVWKFGVAICDVGA